MKKKKKNAGVGLPCPPPVDLPNPGIECRSPTLQEDSFTVWATKETLLCHLKIKSFYVFFLNLYIFLKFFFFPIALARTSSTMLRSSGYRGHTCLSLALTQKASSFLLWNGTLAIGFACFVVEIYIYILLKLRKSSLLPSLLRIFIMNGIDFFFHLLIWSMDSSFIVYYCDRLH